MTEIKGNITFVSNLYPVEKDILREDINFCQHIEDPKRIFELKCNPFFKWFNFTKNKNRFLEFNLDQIVKLIVIKSYLVL